MQGTNQLERVQEGAEGGAGTGRLDRGAVVPCAGDVVLSDPVNHGAIETHAIYGAATPNVGSAYALPRSHPLWAPMDFEVKALAEEDERERQRKLDKFEPKQRRELSREEVLEVRRKNVEYFQKAQKENAAHTTTSKSGRVEFVESRVFAGKREGYFFGKKRDDLLGYHLDYVQMRKYVSLDVGDRCEARYGPMTAYFNGEVVGIHDDDCTFDVRFEHGHLERRVLCENVRRKDWVGKLKATDGISRNLKAANPLMEKKDPAVEWYEQLLLFERGDLDEEPKPPSGLFDDDDDEKDDSQAIRGLYTSEEEGRDGVAEVVASGDVLDPESEGYRRFWDADGRPHRAGPPSKRPWYGSDEDDPAEDAATHEEPYDLCGDGTVAKVVEKKATNHHHHPNQNQNTPRKRRPVAGERVTFRVIVRRLDNTLVDSSYTTSSSSSSSSKEEPGWSYVLFADEDDSSGVPGGTRYVQGLHEALASMRPGEVSHFVVAPEKAYGRKGRYPTVPGYSKEEPRGVWLKYELELLSVADDAMEDSFTSSSSSRKLIVRDPAYGLLKRPARGYDWEGIDLDARDPYRAEGKCDWCGKPGRAMHGGKKFKRCSRCKVARYCSQDCAKVAWVNGHRDDCSVPEDHDVVFATASLLDDKEEDEEDNPETEKTSSSSALTTTKDGKEEEGQVKKWNDKVVARLLSGGGPESCKRVCVIVAYRNQLPLQDRQAQLFKFVPYMVAFLGYAEPACDFTVVVATQTDDGRKFNRGRLMNAAFRDVVVQQLKDDEENKFDSVIFHDVDLLPSEELMPFYSVPPKEGRPLHLGGAWRTKYRAKDFVGGAIALAPADFERANGYPNDCWGWGLDDREFALRLKAAKVKVVRPNRGSYVDLDPINMKNVVFSEERGYYHEYWNMDMENGKLRPKIFGDIVPKYLAEDHVRRNGLSNIAENSELVAKTTEFGGRVVRLLYALENDQERKEGTVALVSARQALQAAYENPRLQGPVADAAMKQTRALAAQGNLKAPNVKRLPYSNPKLLSPEDRYRLQGGKKPIALLTAEGHQVPSSSSDGGHIVKATRQPRRRLAL